MRILRPGIRRRQGGQQFFPQRPAVGQQQESSGYNEGVDFTLREFRREDFETLWSIDQECFPPGMAYSRLELAAYIRCWGSFTLMAESSDLHREGISGPGGRSFKPSSNTLGFIVAQASRRGEGHILTIDVVPAARRRGVGSKLLIAAEDRLRAAKCRRVILETAVDNQAALAFYKRHGYFLLKTIPRYYSSGLDAFVLQRELLSQAEPAKRQPQKK